MNKFKLFPLALAAFAFSACTSEDAVENNPNVEGVKSYVAVNINNVGTGGTRADGDYVNGDANENAISKVRFYFFTQKGDPYKVSGGTTNFKEVEVSGNSTGGANVERITDAVIVIDGVNKSYPYSMMAVVNPGTIESGVLKDFMSEKEVQAAIATQNFEGQKADATNFVMTSSVYANEKNEKVWTSNISGHVAMSETEALTSPVDIYVERVAAKITSTAKGETNHTFQVGETSTGTPVYARIEGWGIDNEKSDAYLVKSIEGASTWTDLGFVWNNPAFNRCYWEKTNTLSPAEHKSWAEYTIQLGENWYTVPNAGVNTTRPLYVVAATLVDANNKPIELCTYKTVEYLSEDDVKATIASENKKYMKDMGNGDYKSIEKEDLQFVAADNKYDVKAQLKDGVNVYVKTGEEYVLANEAANAALGASNARIYKSGMTYYHTAIKHLGAAGKDGEIGMVRNHFYKVNITNITGFGTPVYDKDTDFVPTIPEDDPHTYLAARINVLSWRVVANDVELGK